MREILFRGKRLDNGEWVAGYYWALTRADKTVHVIRTDNLTEANVIVDPETVGQYIGINDFNGKKIFEGDIIRYCEGTAYNCWEESLEHPEHYDGMYDPEFQYSAVKYYEDEFTGFDLDNIKPDWCGLSELTGSVNYVYEVVGNIHDNPELLGGGGDE